MADHPNAALIRKTLEAFEGGDAEAIQNGISDDVVWHEIGRAEPRRGKAELAAAMTQGAVDYTITGSLHDGRDAERADAQLQGGRDLPRQGRQDRRALGVLRRHVGDRGVLRLRRDWTPPNVYLKPDRTFSTRAGSDDERTITASPWLNR
jgi:ketosteroid isomerase-like protein